MAVRMREVLFIPWSWDYAMLMSPLWAPGCDEDETAVHRRRIR